MKAILFDFDGTLADTLPICFYAFQSVFKKFDKKELSTDQITKMFGPSETGIIKENLNHTNIEEAIELYYKKYENNHMTLVQANHKINDLLIFLKNKGIRLGIVTGKARRSLDISLKALNMNEYFEIVITGDDVSRPKPHSEGIIQALKHLGISHKDAVFIGDSDADFYASKQVKVFTIGVRWLPNYVPIKFNVQPDYICTTTNQLKEFVEKRD